MPIVNMYRDGDIAFVNTDHVPTYENFLAHGWVLEEPKTAETPAPAPAAEPEPVPAAPKPETDAPRQRRNKPE